MIYGSFTISPYFASSREVAKQDGIRYVLSPANANHAVLVRLNVNLIAFPARSLKGMVHWELRGPAWNAVADAHYSLRCHPHFWPHAPPQQAPIPLSGWQCLTLHQRHQRKTLPTAPATPARPRCPGR